MKNIHNPKIYLPIKVLIAWMLFTMIIYFFGPYEYDNQNPFIFVGYLIALLLAIFFGYKRGQNTFGRGFRLNINYIKFVKQTILISLSYTFIKIIASGGGNVTKVFTTFVDASQNYTTSSVRSETTLFNYLNMIVAPIQMLAITNVIYSYKKIPKKYRYAGLLLIINVIASAIGSATRSGVVQITVIIFAALLLAIYKKNIVLSYKNKIQFMFITIFALITFIVYSFIITTTRDGNIIILNPITQDPPKTDYFIDNITPDIVHPLTYNLSFYLSHAYYRLNKAMFLPFKGLGFGLSNSFFIMENVESLTNWDGLRKMSYAVRSSSDDRTFGLYWSTFYSWIASDVTWPGTLIFMYFLSYFLSLALKDSLITNNPFSTTTFCLLFYFIFHSVFNNPMQDGAGVMVFFILPLFWYIIRKKYYVIN